MPQEETLLVQERSWKTAAFTQTRCFCQEEKEEENYSLFEAGAAITAPSRTPSETPRHKSGTSAGWERGSS